MALTTLSLSLCLSGLHQSLERKGVPLQCEGNGKEERRNPRRPSEEGTACAAAGEKDILRRRKGRSREIEGGKEGGAHRPLKWAINAPRVENTSLWPHRPRGRLFASAESEIPERNGKRSSRVKKAELTLWASRDASVQCFILCVWCSSCAAH